MCKSLIRNSLVSNWVTQMMTQSSSIPTSIIPGLDRELLHSVVSGQSADSWSCYKKIGQSQLTLRGLV